MASCDSVLLCPPGARVHWALGHPEIRQSSCLLHFFLPQACFLCFHLLFPAVRQGSKMYAGWRQLPGLLHVLAPWAPSCTDPPGKRLQLGSLLCISLDACTTRSSFNVYASSIGVLCTWVFS